MKSVILTIGGVLQTLIALLHIAMFFVTPPSTYDESTKVSIYMMNACITAVVIYFAYVSLFQKQHMLNTNFGRIFSGFIAVFYLQRGIVEAFLKGFSLVDFGPLFVIVILYVIAALPPKSETAL